jgi:hypothetical protein
MTECPCLFNASSCLFQRPIWLSPAQATQVSSTDGFSIFRPISMERRLTTLNEKAPSIFRASVSAEGGLGGLTATVYHFGYSVREHRYAGYAYRSEHGFRFDRLQYALGYKPIVSVTPNDDIRFPDFLIDIILEQQRQDRLLPITERVGIGGEIEFLVMSDRSIHVETVHRFSSYEAESIHIEQRAEA